MTEHDGDIVRCRDCGERLELRTDWRGRRIALDVGAHPLRKPTYVETEMGEFVEVHRHQCEPPPPKPPPYDGRDVRPKIDARGPKPTRQAKPQLELFR
jgi:hypothetical protein